MMDAPNSRKADNEALGERLFSYRIGPPDAQLTFAQRLARENRWTADYAERVIREYYRFIYLAMTAGHEVTPSDQVDQAWHLHLTYTRDYWQRFCGEVLGTPLHHGPTAGGQAEGNRYYEQYAQTLKRYEEAFGEAPPVDIWSPAAKRFGEQPKAFRILPSQVIFLKDKAGVTGLCLLALALLIAGFALGTHWGG